MADTSATAPPNPGTQPTLQRVGEAAKDWVTGLGIVVGTLLVASLSVVVLASTLTQARMTGLAVDGVPLSIWKLDAIRQSWSSIREQIDGETAALGKAEVNFANASTHAAMANSEYRSSRTALDSQLEQLNYQVRRFDADLATEMSGKSPAEQYGRLQAAREQLKAQHPELEPLMESIENEYKAYQPIAARHASADTEVKEFSARIADLHKGLDSAQMSMDKLFNSIKDKLDEPSKAKIENALYELKPTGASVGGLINSLVTAQPEVLTLSLVILMGVLGSCLQISNSYFRGTRETNFGNYFLQVCVGAIAALVIFVVAKAGVPVVTDTSKIGGEAPINPYFISFIAIISGLLSERAISSVQNQGVRFFGPIAADEPNRWLRQDMTEQMKDGLSAATLAGHLGLPQDTTDAILKGEQPIDAARQKLIAIYLRQNARELFTDIPPPGASREPPGATS